MPQKHAEAAMDSGSPDPEFKYHNAEPLWGSQYIWPAVRSIVRSGRFPNRRALDLGCGNGTTTNMLNELGFEVIGIDPSQSGIAIAKKAFPHLVFENASGYDDLGNRFGQFGLVMSLEVLQCCAYPRKISQTVFDLLEPGGMALLSVTYHSYLKNLVLAVTGHLDRHLNPLWDEGPCKFFSMKSFETLLKQTGFTEVEFRLVGRIPILAKSMIAIARR